MTETTTNSMKLLLQKPEVFMQAKTSKELKELVAKAAKKKNMTDSDYLRLSLVEKLVRDGDLTD